MTTHQTAQHIASLLRVATDLINGIDPDSMKDFEFNNLIEPSMKDLMQAYSDLSGLRKVEKKTLKHPVDALLKKGKIELTENRREQLLIIYEELTAIKIKFLSAKQNQYVTWFPLVGMEGDKSAALFLGGAGWTVEPLSIKANGELSGEWEGFDLLEHLAANRPDLDLDEY